MNLEYKAPDGVWYESPEQYLFTGVLGGCGCGKSDEIAEMAYKLLEHFGTPHAQRTFNFYESDDHLTYETLAHWLDSKELIEHGSSVYGSWLSKNGEQLLVILKESINDRTETY